MSFLNNIMLLMVAIGQKRLMPGMPGSDYASGGIYTCVMYTTSLTYKIIVIFGGSLTMLE